MQQIFNCILNRLHAKTIGRGREHSQPDLFGVQFPVHMSSAKRNLNRQTDGGWGVWRTDGRMDWTAARQDALNNTTKCQRTPHACSKFIVTKADGGRGIRERKIQKREE